MTTHTIELDCPLREALDDYERAVIRHALSSACGNVTDAARRLHTHRTNLYKRMRRLGIQWRAGVAVSDRA